MGLGRMCSRTVLFGLVMLAVGCGEEYRPVSVSVAATETPTPAPTAAATATAVPFGPHLFDCTSIAADPFYRPARASSVPIECALDPACRTPQITGHRGVGGALGKIAPEDTLAAYRAAIALGIEYVETDPRPTADGVLVNIHDTKVDRTTDGSGEVAEMSFAEVRSLRIKADGLPGDFTCERVPTLTEVLQTCRGRVVVLVDANKTDRVDLLVGAIQEADALDWAIFDTSSIDKIDRARALEPRLHFQIRPSSADEVVTQLDHFAPDLPAIVEIEAVGRKAAADAAHQRGARVLTNVFLEDAMATFNGDFSGYAKVLDSGVDIVQTERPELVLEFLKSRGLR